MSLSQNCIFCKIIRGEIPSFKLYEDSHVFCFLDVNPLSKGHALIVPKHCGAKLHDIPEEYLSACLPAAKKIAEAQGLVDYNILQNNGAIAHQAVFHVHVHVIPKPDVSQGLGVIWNPHSPSKEELQATAQELANKLK